MIQDGNKNMLTSENVAYYRSAYKYTSIPRLADVDKMHGARRVITFCFLTAVLPTALIVLPLYLRHSVFSDVLYAVAESDVIEVNNGISTIFCQKHILTMNTSFNAYQIHGTPEISQKRKHIRLKKSITLPDDTLEYWGFYLLKGATVALKVCSRYEGSRILVVKGERNLKTCGLLEHNQKKLGGHFAQGYDKVKVTFETAAQEILDNGQSKEGGKKKNELIKNPEFEGEVTDDYLSELEKRAEEHLNKHLQLAINSTSDIKSSVSPSPVETANVDLNNTTVKKQHKRRHAKRFSKESGETVRLRNRRKERNVLQDLLDNDGNKSRGKRELELNSAYTLDRGVEHGGNAGDPTNQNSEENSVSSFENGLLTCYDGQILLSREFPPTSDCTDVHYLDSGDHIMQTTHEVESSGYYYYIFYSDNDFVSNDIHAVFDIKKPTYKYANLSEAKECTNKTTCGFPIAFWSDEKVIVEVPTRDGIEHEEDDITFLTSTCHPRMAIYMFFPIAVIFLILVCAFL